MEVTFQYSPHSKTSSMRAGDVIYIILWPWPAAGVTGIDSSVYVKDGGVWRKH